MAPRDSFLYVKFFCLELFLTDTCFYKCLGNISRLIYWVFVDKAKQLQFPGYINYKKKIFARSEKKLSIGESEFGSLETFRTLPIRPLFKFSNIYITVVNHLRTPEKRTFSGFI